MPVKRVRSLKIWSHLDLDGELVFKKPSDIPFVTYSNDAPCYEVNAYIHSLAHRNLSKDTIRGYAYDVIHLVNFIEKQPILTRFSQLTDSTFTLFMQALQAERTPLGELSRANNTVIKIGKTCLDFLRFVQSFHDLSKFIGNDKSNSITTIEKVYKRRSRDGKKEIEFVEITHSSIPSKDEAKRRHPVSQESALQVWKYIKSQTNKDKRLRDMALYTAMEQIGGRVTELHLIKMTDYERARQTGKLTLSTLKRRDQDAKREIPVNSLLLSVIADYIKVRRRVMKKKKLKHDYLFISLTTGKPLSADSWTTYLNIWKKTLGLKGELHPHLWRHAFITDKLKELILTTQEVNNKDDFRKYILHTEKFKMQLQQWTGHTVLSSLDIYIDLAFSDINGYTEVYNAVSLKASVTLVKRQLNAIKDQLKSNQVTATEAALQIESLLEAFESDIDNCS